MMGQGEAGIEQQRGLERGARGRIRPCSRCTVPSWTCAIAFEGSASRARSTMRRVGAPQPRQGDSQGQRTSSAGSAAAA